MFRAKLVPEGVERLVMRTVDYMAESGKEKWGWVF